MSSTLCCYVHVWYVSTHVNVCYQLLLVKGHERNHSDCEDTELLLSIILCNGTGEETRWCHMNITQFVSNQTQSLSFLRTQSCLSDSCCGSTYDLSLSSNTLGIINTITQSRLYKGEKVVGVDCQWLLLFSGSVFVCVAPACPCVRWLQQASNVY